MRYSVRTHNELLDLSSPRVMAIINITPDSFYTSCTSLSEKEILISAEKAILEGADIVDLGACSTRPGSQPVDAQQEWQRLAPALCAIRHHWPHIPISVDTFRATIADQAILAGADIINDVYGGQSDEKMWDIIAQHQVPYVLTYSATIAPDQHTMSQVMDFMQRSLDCLRKKGVADVIVDPGFGFGKSVEQNYTILQQLHLLEALHAPVLVGVSRKSMLYKPLGIRPQDALPATIAAQTLALERGANVLRVHDVAAAKQAIRIYHLTHSL